MIKRSPRLPNLHAADPTSPLVESPVFPAAWTRPATVALLLAAESWPINVATLPYVGCAMLSWTRPAGRAALVRIAPAATHLRATVTQCRPIWSVDPGIDLTSTVDLTGTVDGVLVRFHVDSASTPSMSWPMYASGWGQYTATTSSAIAPTPAVNLNRQIEITPAIAAATELVVTTSHQSITLWAGAQVADMLTL